MRAISAYQLAVVWRTVFGEIIQDPRMTHEKEITEVQRTAKKEREVLNRKKKVK